MPELWDLAHVMRNDAMEAAAIEIEQLDHAATARRLAREIGVPVADLGLAEGFELEERLTVGTHFGTHLDAPTHFADEIEGRPALTVDRMPLDPLVAEAVVIDLAPLDPGPVTASMLEAAFAAAGSMPRAGQLVMTRTGIEDAYADDPTIRHRGAGLDASGIAWLLDRGVRLTATDSMTQDMPIPWMEERFRQGDREAYFPVHLAGKRAAYTHVEKAAGLGRLLGVQAATAIALPVKVEGGSGAWTRFHAVRGLPFGAGSVEILDLAQPIRQESMEREQSTIRTHGSARRRRQWAKHLGVHVTEIEPRGSWDQVVATTRAGTHLAAPARFTTDPDALTVDRVPLEWCIGPGVVLDVARGPRDATIDRAEIVAALEHAGHRLAAGDIVLLRTGAEDAFDGDPDYPEAGRGLGVDALEHLVGHGVRLIGTDAESLDAPRGVMLAAARGGGRSGLFPVARAMRRLPHAQLLKVGGLARLAALQPTGFWVDAAPVKIEHAGSGWCRPVALVPR